jgi:hypothetical protein
MLRRRVSLSTAVAPARAAHAETIDAFVAWGAASGRAVDPDIAALIHAVQDGDGDRGGWDRSSFFGFYSRRIGNWCTLADCDYPDEELPEALWLWLHHRDLSGRWGADDEPLHDLLKVLLCYGNIGFDGRRQPDEERTRRLVPCECYVSRSIPPPPEEPPTVDDLDRELEMELGYVPRRHG